MQVLIEHPVVRIGWDDGHQSRLHEIWLRDNCGCADCRVALSGERLLYTADIADDLAASQVDVSEAGHLIVNWNDGHCSVYSREWLRQHDYSSASPDDPRDEPRSWGRNDPTPEFDQDQVTSSDRAALEYLDALQQFGAAVVRKTPAEDCQVLRFAKAFGTVRTVAFGIVHDVRNTPVDIFPFPPGLPTRSSAVLAGKRCDSVRTLGRRSRYPGTLWAGFIFRGKRRPASTTDAGDVAQYRFRLPVHGRTVVDWLRLKSYNGR